jgi:mannosyltransferase OCH1-like enzyme
MGDDEVVGARIFQTWKSKISLPENFNYWRSTVIEKNKEFSFTLWDDSDNRNFIARNFPWFVDIYDHLPAEIYRVDCVRYFYLYANGGFYIDLDTECLQPLSKFVRTPGILLGRMGPYSDFLHAIPNAIMASRPREEFWLLVIGLITNLFGSGMRGGGPESLTGHVVLKAAVDIYLSKEPLITSQLIGSLALRLPSHLKPRTGRSDIRLLPQREWYPIDWSDPIHQTLRNEVRSGKLLEDHRKKQLFPESSLVTYWSHVWTE